MSYDDGYDAGRREAARELQPLVDAISDAIFMFNDIEKARALPAEARAVNQYVAMGKWLDRCLKLSGLRHLIQEKPPGDDGSTGADAPVPLRKRLVDI